MSTLYLEYDEFSEGGEPLDDGEWCSYSDTIITWTLGKVLLDKKDAAWCRSEQKVDFDVKKGDTVYVVVVKYGTGDTFSHSNGNGYIEGVYQYKGQASKVVEDISSGVYSKLGKYPPWIGYFESLDDVLIEERIVE